MRGFILFLCIAAVVPATAQTKTTISGSIVNDKNQPLVNATVTLLYQKDSSLAKTSISDSLGYFNFYIHDAAPMLVRVSMTAYQPQYMLVQINQPMSFVLRPVAGNLQEVVVKASKPMIEIKPDRIVFNIENSINAIGNSAFDLLRKSPGVVIDNNDNIALLGNGVSVYIDGKPSPLTGKELSAFLRSLPSTDIESIELIKNPSAKYDAAGTGGIINIKLKKNKSYGLNGSANLGYGIGVYSKNNGGINLNYRNKKVNLFAGYTLSGGINKNYINLYREQNDSIYDQKSTTVSRYHGQTIKTGIDYFANKKNTIGMLFSLFTDNWKDKTDGRTPISSLDLKNAGRTLTANNTANGNKLNANYNINHHYTDTLGHEWNTDIDYGYFTTRQNSYQPNIYTTPDLQTVLEQKIYSIFTDRKIHLLTIKSDYEQNLWGGRLGFGLKSSFVQTSNTFNFSNVTDRQTLIDSTQSNQFTLKENIYAAYINYQIKIKKWHLQLGLRAEQTATRGLLAVDNTQKDKDVKRNYLDFFPSFAVSYAVAKRHSLNLNYSRRINRPGYQSLNPFESKLDELTYSKGNPFLKPEYTNSISITHSFNYKLNTSIGYSRTTDFFAQITDTIEGTRNFIQQRNAGMQQNFYVDISYPVNITKWWTVFADGGVSRLENKVNLGPGRISNVSVASYNIYNQHTIRLPEKLILEVSGFYNSPSVWGGTFLNKSFWGVDAGLQKRILSDKATLKISVSDIFNSMHWRGISRFGGLYMDAGGGWESRQLKMNFSYRFGRKEIKTQRSRITGSDDINKRL